MYPLVTKDFPLMGDLVSAAQKTSIYQWTSKALCLPVPEKGIFFKGYFADGKDLEDARSEFAVLHAGNNLGSLPNLVHSSLIQTNPTQLSDVEIFEPMVWIAQEFVPKGEKPLEEHVRDLAGLHDSLPSLFDKSLLRANRPRRGLMPLFQNSPERLDEDEPVPIELCVLTDQCDQVIRLDWNGLLTSIYQQQQQDPYCSIINGDIKPEHLHDKIIDWGCASWGPVARDVAGLILCTDPKNTEDVINTYLQASSKKEPDFAGHLRKYAPVYALHQAAYNILSRTLDLGVKSLKELEEIIELNTFDCAYLTSRGFKIYGFHDLPPGRRILPNSYSKYEIQDDGSLVAKNNNTLPQIHI